MANGFTDRFKPVEEEESFTDRFRPIEPESDFSRRFQPVANPDLTTVLAKQKKGVQLTPVEQEYLQFTSGEATPVPLSEDPLLLGGVTGAGLKLGLQAPKLASLVGQESALAGAFGGATKIGESLEKGELPSTFDVLKGVATFAPFGGIGAGLGFGIGQGIKAIAKSVGKPVGRVATEVIEQARQGERPLQEVVEEGLSKTIQSSPKGIDQINRILTDEAFVTGEGDASKLITEPFLDKVFREQGGDIPKYVGRTINTKQLTTVGKETKNLIRNVADNVPDAIKPPGETSIVRLESIAINKYGFGSVDEFLEGMRIEYPELGNLPLDQQVRRAADLTDVGHKLLQDHATGTMALARANLLKEGKINTGEFRDMFKQLISITRETGAAKSEFGLSLARQRKDLTPEARLLKFISKNFKDVDSLSDDEMKALMTRIGMLDMNDPMQMIAFMKEFMEPATFKDKFFEYYISALLSGPKTHIVNTVGNTLTFITREVERPISATVDLAKAAVTGTPRERFFRESTDALFGTLKGFPDAVRVALNTFKTEIPASGMDILSKIERPGGRFLVGGAIGGKAGSLIRIPLRALMAMDEFFKALARSSESGALAHRAARIAERKGTLGNTDRAGFIADLLQNPTKRMKKEIEQEALLRTFQTPFGKTGKALESIRESLNKGPIPFGSMIVPFLRTPTNIAKFAFERLPLVKIIAPLVQGKTGGALSDELAKGVLGTAVGALVTWGVLSDRITGGRPRNPSERDIFDASKQAYSFNAGSAEKPNWVSFGRLEPLGMTVGYLADVVTLSKDQPLDFSTVALASAEALGRNFASKTFLQNIAGLANSIFDPDRYSQNFVESMAGSFVPTIVRNVASITEPSDEFPFFTVKVQPIRRAEGPTEAIEKGIPGLNLRVMPVFDMWGEPVVYDEHPLFNLLSPVRVKKVDNDSATKEVIRLGIPFKIKGIADPDDQVFNLKLNREEYIHYIQKAGQLSHERVTALLNNRVYQSLPDETKAKAIEKMFLSSRKVVRNEVATMVIKRLQSKGLSTKDIVKIRLEEQRLRQPETEQETLF